MILLRTLVIFLFTIFCYSETVDDCIYKNDCLAAATLSRDRPNDFQLIDLIKTAFCSYDNGQEKINCTLITEEYNCIPLKDCPTASNLIDTSKYDPDTLRILRATHCSDKYGEPKVYCKQVINRYERRRKSLPEPLLSECGFQPSISKIFGGTPAQLNEFTWIALLKYRRGNKLSLACHGSLINKRYVITAAHCVHPDIVNERTVGNLTKVVLGEYDTRTEIDCAKSVSGSQKCAPSPKEYSIESTIIHPGYESVTGNHDIAILRLNEDVEYSEYIKPICLPLNIYKLKENDNLWIAGWGRTETQYMSPIKLKASIPYLEKTECKNIVESRFGKGTLCVGRGDGVDTCKGDSGGPLMLNKYFGKTNVAFLMGVVSRGPKCGSGSALYMETVHYLPWILDNI